MVSLGAPKSSRGRARRRRGFADGSVSLSRSSNRTRGFATGIPAEFHVRLTGGRGRFIAGPAARRVFRTGRLRKRRAHRARRPRRHCEEPLRRSHPGATARAAPGSSRPRRRKNDGRSDVMTEIADTTGHKGTPKSSAENIPREDPARLILRDAERARQVRPNQIHAVVRVKFHPGRQPEAEQHPTAGVCGRRSGGGTNRDGFLV